jgi:hypothetical protein
MYLSYAYVIKSKVNTLKVKCHTAISYQFQQSTCDKHSFHLRVISLCHGQECMYYVCMIMGVLHHFQQYFSYHNIENVSVWCGIDDIIT